MKSYLLILLSIFFFGCAASLPLLAQQSENEDAPEILTTDLTNRQRIDTSQLDVSFVIFDDDAVTEVIINGEKQEFIRANTLTINKTLTFKRGINKVNVVAIDEEGNKRTRTYTVAYGVDLEPEAVPSKAAEGFQWKIVGDVQYNTDSNPNEDLGLPIDTGDVSIEGQIADDEQDDVQTAANLMAIFSWGKLKALAGYSQSTYSKSLYESLNSKVLMAGVTYGPNPNQAGFMGRYLLLDITMGDEPYAQYNVFAAGYQIGRQDAEDGTTRHLFGIVYNHKTFSDSDLETGNTTLFNWEYSNMDAEKLDYFKSVIAYGTGSNGSEASEYSGYFLDFDWSNKWESGLLQGTGIGVHYKEYPNQEALISGAGDYRIDIPLRFSFHLGWAFNQDWSLKYNYSYKVNASTKNPSYKIVNGLQLSGGF